jgi:hypothetical protein
MDVAVTTTHPIRIKESVSTTLIRPKITNGSPNTKDPNIPMLVAEPNSQVIDPHPSYLVSNPTAANIPPLINAEIVRQPFVNYQRMMRLPNLTTNQSNVFAVWVTIGLFEYDPEDGIGREYIGPSGVPERSKSFYVVDRSIPVGFAPGKQYNTDKTILLRRKVSE